MTHALLFIAGLVLGAAAMFVAQVPHTWLEHKRFRFNLLSALLQGQMINTTQYEIMLRDREDIEIPKDPTKASRYEPTAEDVVAAQLGIKIPERPRNHQANTEKLTPVRPIKE